MNQALSLSVIRELVLLSGVEEFVVCPGARNSPLVTLLLEIHELKKFHFFEERSAAFFALGRIQSSGLPVAVVTTSGTAAGELLPATMEAYYSSLPLILITADRPRRFRGTGAPQSCEQVGIYSSYVERSWDFSKEDRKGLLEEFSEFVSTWDLTRPIHVNICFEEPLLSRGDSVSQTTLPSFLTEMALARTAPTTRRLKPLPRPEVVGILQQFLNRTKNPLVVVGALEKSDQKPVFDFIRRLGAPVYFEAQSGLREDPELQRFRICMSEKILDRAEATGYPIDGVLRIGSVPTLRLWRDLEVLGGIIPVMSVTSRPFSGLSFAPVLQGEIAPLIGEVAVQNPRTHSRDFISADQMLAHQLAHLLREFPSSEASYFHALSEGIPEGSLVYVGNSLPIREWDLAATSLKKNLQVRASRGLNGIDGQLSTFLGMCEPIRENWAIVGDLTAMYDLSGPWALRELDSGTKTRLVVVNNQGGQIFSRMFPQKEFTNPHSISFEKWAQFWNLDYVKWTTPPTPQDWQSLDSLEKLVLEVQPDAGQTAAFWKNHELLWKRK